MLLQVKVKALPHVCTENTAQGGFVESMRQSQVLYLPQDAHLSAVFFIHTSKGSALSDILYSLVMSFKERFSWVPKLLWFWPEILLEGMSLGTRIRYKNFPVSRWQVPLDILYIFCANIESYMLPLSLSYKFLPPWFISLLIHTILADGVIPCCTTMMALDIFSSCILWQYLHKKEEGLH